MGGILVFARIEAMYLYITSALFLVIACTSFKVLGAEIDSSNPGGGGVEISASLTCHDQRPALYFKIRNNWSEEVKITKNWLPWNRSPWFEIYIDTLNKKARPSLSRYREDRNVAVLPGEEIAGTIDVDRLFPGVVISESVSIRWKMIGAPFRSFFSGPQEGEVEFNINHCEYLHGHADLAR